MKIINTIMKNIQFTPDAQNKYDFDSPIISISSRGYDWMKKSFNVGFYLGDVFNNDMYTELDDKTYLLKAELFDDDFEALKAKVKQWYKDHFIEAIEIALNRLKIEDTQSNLNQ